MHRHPATLVAVLALAGCAAAPTTPDSLPEASRDAAPGACYARGAVPAELETVTTEEWEVPPMVAPDGTVLREGVSRIVSDSRVITPRQETWFEAPCPLMAADPDFVAQLQRALAARGYYDGPAHGTYDRDTRVAVAAFQRETGTESAWLSLANAHALGLVAVGRDGA